jgi:hypothetical protein
MRFLPSAALLAGGLWASAHASLPDAIAAHRLLNDIAEARVLQVELQPNAAGDRPPLYAVAFSFEGFGWFYAAESGTRVLGPLAANWDSAAELTRTLREIDGRVVRVTSYAQPAGPERLPQPVLLNNACVIGSLVALANLLARNDEVNEAGLVLLSYDRTDATTATALLVNHCLLVFRDHGRWQCIDPRTPDERFPLDQIAVGAPLDPTLLRLSLRGRYPVRSARFLAVATGTVRRISESAVWRRALGARAQLN